MVLHRISHKEHYVRAQLLGLWYDKYTYTYRPRSPEGSKYKYSNCLHAETLEPLGTGAVLHLEKSYQPEGCRAPINIGNTVSGKRLGADDDGYPVW